MLNRSRCDTTATVVRHFPGRVLRQKIAWFFLNVLRQRLSSLRLFDFRLSTKVLPIAAQMVLPMLVSLIHLQNRSLISSITFFITRHPILKSIYNVLNLVLHVHTRRAFKLFLDRTSYESEYVSTPNHRHDNIQNQTGNRIERHAECL